MKVMHVITGLNDGGAEGVLFRLCVHDHLNDHLVVSLSGLGKYGPLLLEKGIETRALNMRAGWPSPSAFLKLVQLIRSIKPDIVQTWMYHADLFGGLAARAAGITAIVWGIRQTTFQPGKSKTTTIWIARILALLSWWLPLKIAVCARSAIETHQRLGYQPNKMTFVPNGYSLLDLGSEPGNDRTIRVPEFGQSLPLVGMVGRFDPQKDHANLLHALSILRRRGVLFQCILVGHGLTPENNELGSLIEDLGLKSVVVLLGSRSDIATVMRSLDLHVLSSAYGEAFPNVVAEAMACGTPCVVTDVGDAAFIVGDTGWVVPACNTVALADAIDIALRERQTANWGYRCAAARNRVAESFDIRQMVESYRRLWSEIICECTK